MIASTVVFRGQIVHTRSFEEFEAIPNGFVAVRNGKIVGVGRDCDYTSWQSVDFANSTDLQENFLNSSQFLMPGFIDCHIHAPQMPNLGLGLDKPLMEWLESYTFPTETLYQDQEFARSVYKKVVETTIKCGTTLASYFASNHKKSSIILAEEAIQQGQRAFIGKVSSNCNCPDYYVETYDEAIQEITDFVLTILNFNNERVQPIITPRFAISCTDELMIELANLAQKFNLNIQSHISENLSEIEFVKSLFKKSYAKVYADNGILSRKCIMAHAVHLEDEELQLFRQTGASVAHCPASNTCLGSGLCDVKRILAAGIKVGLGTDVSGGNRPSIQDAILRSLDVSQHLNSIKKAEVKGAGTIPSTSSNKEYVPLNYKEAIYLATLGGAEALSVDHKVGNFVEGKSFDAILVDTDRFPIDKFDMLDKLKEKSPLDKLLELVQKFVYVGDDRNIVNVYVEGKIIK